MNRSPRSLALCLLAGFLSLAASCSRKAPDPQPPLAEEHPIPQPVEREPGPVVQPAETKPALNPESVPSQPPRALEPPRREPLRRTKEPPAARAELEEPAAAGTAPPRSKKDLANALFEQPTLLRIQIQIPPAGLNVLGRSRRDNGERPTARATIREGGQVFTNVAVHLKGAAGSFRSISDKPALTLKFDKFEPEQTFHGLNKISLNNSVQDSSFLSEKLARELFLEAGVPVPRASHATVELNGRYLGMYVLLEGANKRFLKRHFEDPKGNLYDGGFCRDIGSRLAVNSGDDPKNHTGLNALRAASRGANFAKLDEALDVDRFVTMVAMETLLGHWDGYTLNRNNWRVFHDLKANRMVFIPHGLDQLFGGGPQMANDGSLLPQNIQGQVSRAVLGTAEGQRRYRARLEQLYRDVFRVDEISAKLDRWAVGISTELAKTDPDGAKLFRQRANGLKHRVARRMANLRPNFGLPIEPVKFGSDRTLPLTNWKQGVLQSGDPAFREEDADSGKRALVVQANGESTGSWRTRVVLAPGQYRFEGRVRVVGVTVAEGDTRSGAGLRISKGTMPPKLTGTADWKLFQSAFPVEKASEVELICELKATAGEAWFDATSLRLVQVR